MRKRNDGTPNRSTTIHGGDEGKNCFPKEILRVKKPGEKTETM